MNSRSYYAFSDDVGSTFNRCSIESTELPLTVNCAGQMQSPFPFTTDNPEGRLDYYLMYIKSGELAVDFPDGERVLSAGTAVIFPPRYRYRYRFEGGRICYLWCHFSGSDALSLLRDIGMSPLPCARYVGRDAQISAGFERIFTVFAEGGPLRDRALGAALGGLLVDIALPAHAKSGGLDLSRSVSYINENYTRDIHIPELARMENLSNSRYHVLFSEAFGVPPVRYIAKLRIQTACELLLTTDLPIKQIGLSVGYRDPHFFSKLFKAHTGVSPLRYREK